MPVRTGGLGVRFAPGEKIPVWVENPRHHPFVTDKPVQRIGQSVLSGRCSKWSPLIFSLMENSERADINKETKMPARSSRWRGCFSHPRIRYGKSS